MSYKPISQWWKDYYKRTESIRAAYYTASLEPVLEGEEPKGYSGEARQKQIARMRLSHYSENRQCGCGRKITNGSISGKCKSCVKKSYHAGRKDVQRVGNTAGATA